MDELLKDINDKLSSLSDGQDTLLSRVDKLEASEKKSNREGSKYMLGSLFGDSSQRHGQHHGGAPLPGATLSTGASGSLGTAGNIPQAGAVARVDNTVQDEYQSIKDKVSSVKIPQELRVGTSKTGIKREDQNTANIIANCAKYVETTLKLLWNLDEEASQDELLEIFNVQKAQIDYLRQEHSSLVVAGQFGAKTSQLFKNLSRGTTNLDDKQLDTLLKAVQITSNEHGARQQPRESYRGRYNGGSSSFNYSGGYGYGGGRGRATSFNYNRNNNSANNYSWNKQNGLANNNSTE